MYLLLSDARLNTYALIIIAIITIIPTTLAAYWSRGAKKDSAEAKDNSAEARENSAEARANSAHALHEVRTNGGMSDPNPNLNDHVKYQTEMTEFIVRKLQAMDLKVDTLDEKVVDHLKHSQLMDQALAEVYMKVRPEAKEWPTDDPPHQSLD